MTYEFRLIKYEKKNSPRLLLKKKIKFSCHSDIVIVTFRLIRFKKHYSIFYLSMLRKALLRQAVKV